MSEALKIDQALLKRDVVPISALVANEWNPNKMDERTYEAERESIREYGFVDPILVRDHPTQEGKHEIIDGEHRWKAAGDEGYDEVIIDSLGPLDDLAAKKLTVILNETRGEADVALLGQLLSSINAEADGQEWWTGLPYSQAERDHLLAIGDVDWDTFAAQPEGDGEGEVASHMVELQFDAEGNERWQAFMGMLSREWEVAEPELIALRALQEAAERL